MKLVIRGVRKRLKTFLAPNLEADICSSLLPATLIAWDDGIARHSAQFFRGLGFNAWQFLPSVPSVLTKVSPLQDNLHEPD